MPEQPLETIQAGGYTIRLFPDTDPSNPRDDDNLGTIVIWGRRRSHLNDDGAGAEDQNSFLHNLLDYKDRQPLDEWRDTALRLTDCEQEEEIENQYNKLVEEEALKRVILLHLHIYEHGGVMLKVGGEDGADGCIYITHEKAKEEGLDPEKIETYLKNEIETYNSYLEGSVYGYTTETLCGHEVDSCWGFYGLDDCKAQAMENIPS